MNYRRNWMPTKALLARIESIRLQAGKAMGLGDVSNMVIPKPVLISPAQKGGAINVRYFMPHSCHRALGDKPVLLLFPVVVHWKAPSPDKSSLL
ncbi:3-methylitaconate isomerase [Escherichia coli]|uniref:3-methylitaconate isomerase n=1 Tax=Escherichia coli TaxID=562 RepID=A0A377AWZ7_ECOLX|nr:3-methylitaconate isomerase [Escherichia coli]